MGKIIAIANHKGGVGKTTSVASIGAVLAQKGKKTLIIDLDAQANLTGSLSGEQYERTIYDALREREGLPVVKISENLFLTPSCLDLAGIELELSSSMSRESILLEISRAQADSRLSARMNLVSGSSSRHSAANLDPVRMAV